MGIFSRYYQPEGPPALRAEKIVIEVRYEVNAEMPTLVSGGHFEMTISAYVPFNVARFGLARVLPHVYSPICLPLICEYVLVYICTYMHICTCTLVCIADVPIG